MKYKVLLWSEANPRLFALISLILGLLSLLFFERHVWVAGLIGTLVLVFWLVFVLWPNTTKDDELTVVKPWWISRAFNLLHQQGLFYVLPILWRATDWRSAQLAFTLMVSVWALLTLSPKHYRRWCLHHDTSVAILNGLIALLLGLAIFPLILQLSTRQSWFAAGGMAASLLLVTWIRGFKKPKHALVFVLGLGMLGAFWLIRSAVPVMGIQVTQLVASFERKGRDPGASVRQIQAYQMRQGLYVFSRILAPKGLKEPIKHLWYQNNKLMDVITISIQGGDHDEAKSKAGYRTWSHKLKFPSTPQGHWRVDVMTSSDQRLGSVVFDVK